MLNVQKLALQPKLLTLCESKIKLLKISLLVELTLLRFFRTWLKRSNMKTVSITAFATNVNKVLRN